MFPPVHPLTVLPSFLFLKTTDVPVDSPVMVLPSATVAVVGTVDDPKTLGSVDTFDKDHH